MTIPALGNNAYLQIGEETAYGTAVPPQTKLEVITANISPVIGVIRDPSLYSGVSRRSMYQGGIIYRGNISTRVTYSSCGIGMMLKSLLGSAGNTTTGGWSAATSIGTHTFFEASDPESLTFELIEGNPDGTTAATASRFSGVQVVGVTFRTEAGQGDGAMLTADWEVLAKTKSLGTVTSSLTFPPLFPALFQHGSSPDIGAGTTVSLANQRFRSMELSIRNTLADDRFYFTSTTPEQPVRTDFLTTTWRVQQEFMSYDAWNKAIAFTDIAPNFKFLYGDGTHSVEFDSNKAKIIEYSNPIEGYGILFSNITAEAYNDGNTSVSVSFTDRRQFDYTLHSGGI